MKTISLKRTWIGSGASAAQPKGISWPTQRRLVAMVERTMPTVRAKQRQILEVTIKRYQRPVIMVRGTV